MSDVLVINKTERILALPRQDNPGNATQAPVYQPRFLRPGVNQVDADLVERLRERPTVKAWIKEGWIKLPKGDGKGEGLGAFDESEAASLIADCFDPELLGMWEETEKRKPVKSAIRKRAIELAKLIEGE